MTNQLVKVTIESQLALVTIDNPPVNALSASVRQGLLDAVHEIDDNSQVIAALLLCDGRTFIAGADINEFGKPPLDPALPDVIRKIETTKIPWIAAIHGTALGGGLEVALGCQYRIASSTAKLGLPEVKLGLLPGAGGTLRLPRLIGASSALDMMISGKPVSAHTAFESGLIDRVAQGCLQTEAVKFAAEINTKSSPSALVSRDIPPEPDENAWKDKLKNLRLKYAGQSAPLSIIDVLENSMTLPWQEALKNERSTFNELKASKQSAALRYLFKAERTATRLDHLKSVEACALNQVGIIGGGTMGMGIAAACLLAGLNVILIERDSEALQAGTDRVEAVLDNSLTRRLISEQQRNTMLANFQGSTEYADLGNADLVIEAVFEDMDVKLNVFAQLDKHTKADAILASNTSYLDVNEIAKSVKNPGRVIGLHFFSPAHIMKLLELIVTEHAEPISLATGFSLAKRLNKICVPAGVCDGFIGNRIMSSYRRVCDEMLEEGALPQDIDAAMIEYGFPMGVFQMQDLAGLDIAYAMRKRQSATRDPESRYVHIADKLCELGRFGRKSGRGWYVYDGKKAHVDDEVTDIILAESKRSGLTRRSFSSEQIMDTILHTMQREGQAVIDEGIAQSAEAVDVVMVNGYSFPRWKGGPMHVLNSDR